MIPTLKRIPVGTHVGIVCPDESPCRGSGLVTFFDSEDEETAVACWNRAQHMKLPFLKPRGPAWLGLARYIPYPLRAAKITIDFQFFGIWWLPEFHHNRKLNELARRDGSTIWFCRWLWFQVSYSRWV